ncbi:MAG: T9SS type A sorting domain-containing protein [Candidatus Cloacimonas acidaminovorans]
MPCHIWKRITLLITIVFVGSLSALVPPVPMYKNPPIAWQATRLEGSFFAEGTLKTGKRNLPNNILVLRVQFSDVSFRDQAGYPDNLVHDDVFFNRWMIHLKDFFLEASHLQYELDYYIYPQVLTMPHSLSFYGADGDNDIDVDLPQILPDILALIDEEVDFSQYGGIIIFHSGTGQESDINSIRPNEIWSTFLTRKKLQKYFDPENDLYAGYPTDDGIYLTNIIIVPEDEFQDYFPSADEENAANYLFSMYGVLAHQLGHLLGLPTLYDNDDSNGISQGIGNWGLMGTGLWNGSGYVPAQLCAWSRYFLGWETPLVLFQNSDNNSVDYFLNHSPEAIRLYKVPISTTEYFLIENRQQNPDGSLDPLSNLPSYSFKLLPAGEQDYYEDNPLTPEDESLLPYFNFMENTYLGSEWDFFLPGLGGPIPDNSPFQVDGSGILIWHIDENVINANFTANFNRNYVNSNALHKGVDLEEADGIQHLDTAAYNIYKWGSPYDSFRAGNNNYFGNQHHNGMLSLPTSESYYGGIPLEITDISNSGNQMTFSVNFGWRLTTSYQGINPINACAIDFDGDGKDELFFPLPNGKIYIWKNEELLSNYPIQLPFYIPYNYTWDGESIYLPLQRDEVCCLYKLNSAEHYYAFRSNAYSWLSHPVDIGENLALPLKINADNNAFAIKLYNKTDMTVASLADYSGKFIANLIHYDNQLSVVYQNAEGEYWLSEIDLSNYDKKEIKLPIPADSIIVAVFKAPIADTENLIIQCPNSVYCLQGANIVDGFPYVHNLVAASDSSFIAPLTFADVDGNGSLDILIGGESDFAIIDYSGKLMNPETQNPEPHTDFISAGIYAMDIDNDNSPEIIGNFKYNRLNIWEHNYRPKIGYPVSFAERSRTLPFVSQASDNNWYIYCATDNGLLFRNKLENKPQITPACNWICEYGNLRRSASYTKMELPNQYQTDELFVPGQVYIYPNPLKSIYRQKIQLNVMTSRDAELELSIFDISGTLVYRQKGYAKAYLKNLDIFDIPADKLCSGVYIAIIKSSTSSKRLKFAIEK